MPFVLLVIIYRKLSRGDSTQALLSSKMNYILTTPIKFVFDVVFQSMRF